MILQMNFPSYHKLKTTSLEKTMLSPASSSPHQQNAAFQKKTLHVVKTFIMIISDESENKLVIQDYLFLASFMKINSKSMNQN